MRSRRERGDVAMTSELIAGRFRKTALLGSGGMGEVWLAFDERLRRSVAVKLFIPDGLDTEAAERLAREARAAAVIQHANVVRVFDFVEEDGRLLIVMEYVEGETVRARLAAGPLPQQVAVELAAQVCDGLTAAHRADLIHRDLKPENVIISMDGIAKVVDFGLAKRMSDEAAKLTQAGIVIGTPQYMAPEQLAGSDLDARTDVHGAGLLLFELLTGTPPYAGETLAQLMYGIVSSPPPVERLQAKGVSPGVIHVITTALAKKPADRWQTADAMAEALRSALLDSTAGATSIRRATPIPLSKVSGTPVPESRTPIVPSTGQTSRDASGHDAFTDPSRSGPFAAFRPMSIRMTRVMALVAALGTLVLISVRKYSGGDVPPANATGESTKKDSTKKDSTKKDSTKKDSTKKDSTTGTDSVVVRGKTESPPVRSERDIERQARALVRTALATQVRKSWGFYASSVTTTSDAGKPLLAKFSVTIDPDGNLTDVSSPEQVSGSAVFDNMASQAVQNVQRVVRGTARSPTGWRFTVVIAGKAVRIEP